MTPPLPSSVIGGSWINCTTGHCLKLWWPPLTWPRVWPSSNENDQDCLISGGGVDWGTILIKGYTPAPPSRHVPTIQNFWFPPLTTNFLRALCTISHYLYIFANRIIFYSISEQYTSLCCWLIQMFIHKPFSILPLEWTALLTVAWFPVSYRTQFMARRLSF